MGRSFNSMAGSGSSEITVSDDVKSDGISTYRYARSSESIASDHQKFVARFVNIRAGFLSTRKNAVHLFYGCLHVLLDYAEDIILDDRKPAGFRFRSLSDYIIGEAGPQIAFTSHDKKEAYLMDGPLFFHIDVLKDEVLDLDPCMVNKFPSLDVSIFIPDGSLDGAFESSKPDEAYIFGNDLCALINYKEFEVIEQPRKITDRFPSLKGSIFENGIDAAFASHSTDFEKQGDVEAFLFKKDQCALFRFSPDGVDGSIISGPMKIVERWPSLSKYLPAPPLWWNSCDDDYEKYF